MRRCGGYRLESVTAQLWLTALCIAMYILTVHAGTSTHQQYHCYIYVHCVCGVDLGVRNLPQASDARKLLESRYTILCLSKMRQVTLPKVGLRNYYTPTLQYLG